MLSSQEKEVIEMVNNDLVKEEVEEALQFRAKQVEELKKGVQGPGKAVLNAEEQLEEITRNKEQYKGAQKIIEHIKEKTRLEGQ